MFENGLGIKIRIRELEYLYVNTSQFLPQRTGEVSRFQSLRSPGEGQVESVAAESSGRLRGTESRAVDRPFGRSSNCRRLCLAKRGSRGGESEVFLCSRR